jgi:hypothetical protein
MRSQIVVIEHAFKRSAGKHELIWTRNVVGLFLTCNAGGAVCTTAPPALCAENTIEAKRAGRQTGNVSSLEE